MENIMLSNLEFEKDVIIYTATEDIVKEAEPDPIQVNWIIVLQMSNFHQSGHGGILNWKVQIWM